MVSTFPGQPLGYSPKLFLKSWCINNPISPIEDCLFKLCCLLVRLVISLLLKARNDVLGRKNWGKKAFSVRFWVYETWIGGLTVFIKFIKFLSKYCSVLCFLSLSGALIIYVKPLDIVLEFTESSLIIFQSLFCPSVWIVSIVMSLSH